MFVEALTWSLAWEICSFSVNILFLIVKVGIGSVCDKLAIKTNWIFYSSKLKGFVALDWSKENVLFCFNELIWGWILDNFWYKHKLQSIHHLDEITLSTSSLTQQSQTMIKIKKIITTIKRSCWIFNDAKKYEITKIIKRNKYIYIFTAHSSQIL